MLEEASQEQQQQQQQPMTHPNSAAVVVAVAVAHTPRCSTWSSTCLLSTMLICWISKKSYRTCSSAIVAVLAARLRRLGGAQHSMQRLAHPHLTAYPTGAAATTRTTTSHTQQHFLAVGLGLGLGLVVTAVRHRQALQALDSGVASVRL
jgi:hypothetical protein